MNIQADMQGQKLAAVCGLYCGACSLFIGTTEDPEKLKRLAGNFKLSEEAIKCHGCRSDIKSRLCKECQIFACAAKRGINFCSECGEYPCEGLKRFQGQPILPTDLFSSKNPFEGLSKSKSVMPHRIELWDNLEQIKKIGYTQWLQKVRERYSCPRCQTVNSAYDLKCRKCGQDPSCDYVARHKQAIEEFLANR